MRLLALQKRQEKKANGFAPTPELPDTTPVDQLQLPPRIKRVLLAEGLATVGEVRETSDDTLMAFQDFGQKSLAFLRDKLGLPSKDGVKSVEKKG
jgi:DNA-directed RNA polymerase alpha subunit